MSKIMLPKLLQGNWGTVSCRGGGESSNLNPRIALLPGMEGWRLHCHPSPSPSLKGALVSASEAGGSQPIRLGTSDLRNSNIHNMLFVQSTNTLQSNPKTNIFLKNQPEKISTRYSTVEMNLKSMSIIIPPQLPLELNGNKQKKGT